MVSKKCPKCGTEVQVDSKVCPKCGFPVKLRIQEKKKNSLLKEIVNNKIFIICQILVGLCLLYYSCENIYIECLLGGFEFDYINDYVLLALILLLLSIPLIFIGLKKLNIKKSVCYSATVLLFALFPIMIAKGCYDKAEDRKYRNTNVEVTKSTRERFTSIENMQEDLNGTIWTWTETLSDRDREMYKFWKRFEFKNGKLYIQSAAPSKGEWGEASEIDYTIEEHRYSDTGRKFIAVIITGLSYFVPATGQYVEPYMFDYDVMMERKMRERDFQWD